MFQNMWTSVRCRCSCPERVAAARNFRPAVGVRVRPHRLPGLDTEAGAGDAVAAGVRQPHPTADPPRLQLRQPGPHQGAVDLGGEQPDVDVAQTHRREGPAASGR